MSNVGLPASGSIQGDKATPKVRILLFVSLAN